MNFIMLYIMPATIGMMFVGIVLALNSLSQGSSQND